MQARNVCFGWICTISGAGFVNPSCDASAQDVIRYWDFDTNNSPQGVSPLRAGDIDGDGVDDLIIGTQPTSGTTATVYSGATGEVIYDYPQVVSANSAFGAAGDVDGDGRDDFLIGDSYGAGHVFVYSGETGLLLKDITRFGSSGLGSDFASLGDLDGDGIGDFAVAGSGFIAFYAGSTWSELDSLATTYARLADAGDLDGDGVHELWLGQPSHGQWLGKASAYSVALHSTIRDFDGEEIGDRFGSAIANAGDVDGDGVPDVIVSAPFRSKLGFEQGKVYVYSGATSSLLTSFEGEAAQDRLGEFLSEGRDVDGDGLCDLVIASTAHASYAGRIYVYSGASYGLYATVDGDGNLGIGLSAAGDVDRDGSPDVFVRGHGYDSGSLVPRVFEYSLSRGPQPLSLSVDRARYTGSAAVTMTGRYFLAAEPPRVQFGDVDATNVVILDDATLTCDTPPNSTGPAAIRTGNSLGRRELSGAFTYTPAILWDGDATPGGHVSVHYLCDPKDGLFAVAGVPPVVSIPTPPFDGALCILPFTTLFVIPPRVWPFDEFTLDADIPGDPTLSGLTVLVQALVGPSFSKPKDASWTNCGELLIQ